MRLHGAWIFSRGPQGNVGFLIAFASFSDILQGRQKQRNMIVPRYPFLQKKLISG